VKFLNTIQLSPKFHVRPLNRQLIPLNFQIQHSYLHFNVIMCIDVDCHIIDEGMFTLFTHLSADYCLRHLVNSVAIHMITLEWR
jgi:hypothetical protein